MKPRARDAYFAALTEVLAKLQERLRRGNPRALPVTMYVAGGAALHLLTGARVSEDVDAAFSKRILLPDDIEVAYRDADGRARTLYLDRNYNDTLGLLHEDAYADAKPLSVPGIDPKVLEVRVLSPLDLAVTKLGRFGDQDRADIELLAAERLIDSPSVRKRAGEALGAYAGDLDSVRTSIEAACRVIDEARKRRK